MSRLSQSVRLAIATMLFLPLASARGQRSADSASLSADATQLIRNQLLLPLATQADLGVIDLAFRSLHPGVYRYTSRQAWMRRIDSLRTYFSVPRTRGESYLAFSKLTASVKCGHTYLSFWNQPRATQRWLTQGADKLPFEYDFTPANYWVVRRTGVDTVLRAGLAILPGDTIKGVNGVGTPQIIARLLPYIRGDGDDNGKRRALLDFRHRKEFEAIDVFLSLILPPRDGMYTVKLRRAGAQRDTTVRVASMSAARRRLAALPVPDARPWHALTRDGDVAMLRVDRFDYGRDADQWEPFVTGSFRSLARDSVQSLVLDLRENEGGSDQGAEFLLRHLIRAPLLLPALRRYVVYDTVPTVLRPNLETWDKSFYDRRGTVVAMGDGTFNLTEKGAWPDTVLPSADAFTGRVFVVTSYVNSSASHIMLRLLARQPGVTLVGDPTGGSLRAHTGGNLFFLKLANSAMEVDLPLIAYDWGKLLPSGGVLPDVRVPARDALRVAMGAATAKASSR